MRLAGALARAGVPMLAGTDLPNAVLVPGSSLLDELDALVEAGLTRQQALDAATSAPARFFQETADWGAVAVGRRADLLLLDGNPLDDLRTLRAPAGVVLGGRKAQRRGRKARALRDFCDVHGFRLLTSSQLEVAYYGFWLWRASNQRCEVIEREHSLLCL